MSLEYGFCLGPLDTEYNSAQFSGAIRSFSGDGVCDYGTRFALTLRSGFSVYLGTGYALVGGRWIESDERVALSIPPAGNTADRYDAIAAVADLSSKEVALKVLEGIDIAAVRANPSLIRNESSYAILLYLLRVRRGATTISEQDVTDLRDDTGLCGRVSPIGSISTAALKVYAFLSGGIDDEVSRIVGLAEDAVSKGSAAVDALETLIRQRTGNGVGDVVLSAQKPLPEDEWLLCDGTYIPSIYPELSEMLGGARPHVFPADDRLEGYVYSGPPTLEVNARVSTVRKQK